MTVESVNPWIQMCHSHSESVVEAIKPIPPMGWGILCSEAVAFICACLGQKVERVVESGRAEGYSTEALAVALPDCEIISIERSPRSDAEQRLDSYANLKLLTGDGQKLVGRYINGRTALLLDGPKGFVAKRIIDSSKDRIVFGAIHDMCAGNECRLQITDPAWYTDDPDFVREYGCLDDEWWPQGGYRSREEMVSQSFCLGFFRGSLWID